MGASGLFFHAATIKSWVILDLVSLLVIAIIRRIYFQGGWRQKSDKISFNFMHPISFDFWPWLVCVLSIIRTIADYWSDWAHYFP